MLPTGITPEDPVFVIGTEHVRAGMTKRTGAVILFCLFMKFQFGVPLCERYHAVFDNHVSSLF